MHGVERLPVPPSIVAQQIEPEHDLRVSEVMGKVEKPRRNFHSLTARPAPFGAGQGRWCASAGRAFAVQD